MQLPALDGDSGGSRANVYACLVHEDRACVFDLIRNLRHLDPRSSILLYNGGRNPRLLDGLTFEQHGVFVHPEPSPLRWGRLHDFALDCLRFAQRHLAFDTLTVVDSDQLAVRPGYSSFLARHLESRSGVGMLGNACAVQGPQTEVPPAQAAHRELERWRPFLRRFPGGEKKWVHWCFWPSTVFTAAAARDLIRLFDTDSQLRDLMERTEIWATEEVLLPTLVALLGYEVARSPCSYDFVKYRATYPKGRIRRAFERPDVYWLHPVPRRLYDPLRRQVRERFDRYRRRAVTPPSHSSDAETTAAPQPVLPLLERLGGIEGWLEDDEADLLIAATARTLQQLRGRYAIVEIGNGSSGRSTVALGSLLQATRPELGRVVTLDPFETPDPLEGSEDAAIAPTLARFRRHLADAGLSDRVQLIRRRSAEVDWDRPVGLLYVDGAHDYSSVASDFARFDRWILPGGYVVFHDYAEYFPGVMMLVSQILDSAAYRRVSRARSLVVLEKVPPRAGLAATAPSPIAGPAEPLVSCIMPTFDRRRFVPRAIEYFLRQDYPRRELIVVDDGRDRIADLIPNDARIRYLDLSDRHSIGTKRNLAGEAAAGELIVHWDDDDWIAPWRLRYQIDELLRAQADVCGLDRVLYHDLGSRRSWQYVYPTAATPWVAGNTLCYTRDFWHRNPFPDVTQGEDLRFLWTRSPKRLLAHADNSFFVAFIHPANASPKRTENPRWHSCPTAKIRQVVGDDWTFYDELT